MDDLTSLSPDPLPPPNPQTRISPSAKAVIEGSSTVNVYVWAQVMVCAFAMISVTIVVIMRPAQSTDFIGKILGFALPIAVGLQAMSQRAQTQGLNGRLNQLVDAK